MSTAYCNNCNQQVAAKRKIGVGTLILVVITSGFWLLAILFYHKRCNICGDTNFGNGVD